MTSKNNRTPRLYYIKLCASLQIHQWIQTRDTVRKCSIQVNIKISDFCPMWPWNLMGWPWKTIEHLFYAKLSFVHPFKASGKLNLKLESGNAQFWSKSATFLSRVTLKFDDWPWKNNRAPLLCCLKLCASFHSHQWILTVLTVWKCPIWVKMTIFLSRVALKFDGWLWKTIGYLF